MKINVENARTFGVSWPWVHFTLSNTDIMTALNRAPLVLKRIESKKFAGRIFAVTVLLDIVHDVKPDPKDEISIIADVKMPFGLGRTHTVARYRYSSVDVSTTLVDLQFSLETRGPFMAIYASVLKRHIDDYLHRILSDNERAGVLLQDNDPALRTLLSDEQLERIEAYRRQEPKIVRKERADAVGGVIPSITDGRAWHPELSELTTLYQRVRGKMTQLENELIRIRETQDAVATLLVARRMLEVIVTHIYEEMMAKVRGSEPLARVLDKIAHGDVVPEYVITSMHNLNRLSTYGAHPKDFSPRQVREALLALCSIMEWYVATAHVSHKNGFEPDMDISDTM